MSTTDTRDIAPAMTDVPPSPAGKTATRPNALPLNKLTLIGITGRPDSRRALLRKRDGTILPVTTGDRTPGGTVKAIGADEVLLARAGKTIRLSMPE
ncbi:MAG: hypothetical protein QNJ44_13010 [Rhodobacter sp.]|nr:hypothetical protein [Rhodobacter sp.]